MTRSVTPGRSSLSPGHPSPAPGRSSLSPGRSSPAPGRSSLSPGRSSPATTSLARFTEPSLAQIQQP
jgi:hypothetical protein